MIPQKTYDLKTLEEVRRRIVADHVPPSISIIAIIDAMIADAQKASDEAMYWRNR